MRATGAMTTAGAERRAGPLSWIGPTLLVAVAVFVGSVGFTDPSYLEFQDAPRHLMNGVFLHDLVRDAPIVLHDPIAYAQQYYARYPALSLGHHPLLLPLALVPLFLVLGISVFAAPISTCSTVRACRRSCTRRASSRARSSKRA